MLSNRPISLVVFCGIGLLSQFSFSQDNPITPHKTSLLDQFFLVRRPDFIENCAGVPKADAIIVFKSKIPNSAASFEVLTRSGGVISALVKGTMVLDTCEEFEEEYNSFGLLQAKSPLGWSGEIDALIGFQSIGTDPLRVGKVSLLADTLLMSRCLALAIPTIPDSEFCGVKSQFQITAPGGQRKFLLISVDRDLDKRTKLAGDQAIYPTGFVFSLENGNPHLLFAENYLTKIFSISDLDNDGIYEVTVYSGGWGEGSYEVRLFDGKVFMKDKRVLYHWMD